MNRLRSVLLEFYPQALIAFPNLRHKAALAVLSAASTPALGHALTKRKVVALLHGCGRRNDLALVEQILRDLHANTLRQPAPVELALGHAVLSLLAVLTGMHAAVERLEHALAEQFDQHPQVHVLRSAPGLGPLLGAASSPRSGTTPPASPPPQDYARSPAPPPSPAPLDALASCGHDTSATSVSPTPATGGPSRC